MQSMEWEQWHLYSATWVLQPGKSVICINLHIISSTCISAIFTGRIPPQGLPRCGRSFVNPYNLVVSRMSSKIGNGQKCELQHHFNWCWLQASRVPVRPGKAIHLENCLQVLENLWILLYWHGKALKMSVLCQICSFLYPYWCTP